MSSFGESVFGHFSRFYAFAAGKQSCVIPNAGGELPAVESAVYSGDGSREPSPFRILVVSYLNPTKRLAGGRDCRSYHKDQASRPDPASVTNYYILDYSRGSRLGQVGPAGSKLVKDAGPAHSL